MKTRFSKTGNSTATLTLEAEVSVNQPFSEAQGQMFQDIIKAARPAVGANPDIRSMWGRQEELKQTGRELDGYTARLQRLQAQRRELELLSDDIPLAPRLVSVDAEIADTQAKISELRGRLRALEPVVKGLQHRYASGLHGAASAAIQQRRAALESRKAELLEVIQRTVGSKLEALAETEGLLSDLTNTGRIPAYTQAAVNALSDPSGQPALGPAVTAVPAALGGDDGIIVDDEE